MMNLFNRVYQNYKTSSIKMTDKLNDIKDSYFKGGAVENKYTKEPVFQKVKCYDVKSSKESSHTDSNDNSSASVKIVLENENPQMIQLSTDQKVILENYIKRTLYDYRKGTIHLDKEVIDKFNNVQFAINRDCKISKYCVDFVMADLSKSYTRIGYVDPNLSVDTEDILYNPNILNKPNSKF